MLTCLLPALLMLTAELIGCTTITTPLGALKGWSRQSRGGLEYMAFTRIPYGQPPIGSLRLKNPEPFGKWSGELDATKDGPPCLQYNFFLPNRSAAFAPLGSEDCLFLNVYVPKNKTQNKLPVLFYIHGGGFQFGGPGLRVMADYIMDEDVILVTLTYRLNAFGFLSLENELIPGNFGLKDQALALKWVKDNIHSFGGDQDKITVFGESAGAASSHHILLSPMTRDIISGAFSSSGTINYIWSLSKPGVIRGHSMTLAESVGCHELAEMLDCLQALKADDLLRATLNPSFAELAFRPCVEPNLAGAMIPVNPIGLTSNKPWITSYTNGEYILSLIVNELHGQRHAGNIDRTISFLTRLKPNETEKLNKIKARYIKGDNENDITMQIAHIYGDVHMVYPAIDSLISHAGTKYFYTFEHRGQISLADAYLKTRTREAAHGDEIVYEFNVTPMFDGADLTKVDRKVSKDFIKLLVNFAAFQNPTPIGSNVQWKPWTGNEILRITSKGNFMAETSFQEKLDDLHKFWDPILQN